MKMKRAINNYDKLKLFYGKTINGVKGVKKNCIKRYMNEKLVHYSHIFCHDNDNSSNDNHKNVFFILFIWGWKKFVLSNECWKKKQMPNFDGCRVKSKLFQCDTVRIVCVSTQTILLLMWNPSPVWHGVNFIFFFSHCCISVVSTAYASHYSVIAMACPYCYRVVLSL